MPKTLLEAIEAQLSKVTDPRKDRTKDHKLIDIIAMAICAILFGAKGWTDMEIFGNSKVVWLKGSAYAVQMIKKLANARFTWSALGQRKMKSYWGSARWMRSRMKLLRSPNCSNC